MSGLLPMVFRLDGRVAVVTGAGGGIGGAIAATLAGAGAAVVAGDIDEAAAQRIAERVIAAGGRAVAQQADVTRRADLETLVLRASAEFGGLHVMCNLGGPPTPLVEMGDVTDGQWDEAMAGHLRSVLHGCQAALPHLIASGGGAILNMSSSAADHTIAANGLYAIAKSGVITLTRVLAKEVASRGVRVNALAPGATVTGFGRRFYVDEAGEIDEARRAEWLEQMAALSPLGTVAEPEDQAWLALYLVSDAARFVTGQVVRANGGWSMA